MQDICWPQGPLPPRLSASELRAAGRTFKKFTSVIDGGSPRQFSYLTDLALECLGWLYWLWEAFGCTHDSVASLLFRMLPKPDGGRRPILHFRSGFRLWSRWAQRRVRNWARVHLTDACLNNGQGRAPGDMAWRYGVRADLAQARGQCAASKS